MQQILSHARQLQRAAEMKAGIPPSEGPFIPAPKYWEQAKSRLRIKK